MVAIGIELVNAIQVTKWLQVYTRKIRVDIVELKYTHVQVPPDESLITVYFQLQVYRC